MIETPASSLPPDVHPVAVDSPPPPRRRWWVVRRVLLVTFVLLGAALYWFREPLFFGFVMKSLPAGLNLYILCNNILSVAQQTYLRRKMASMPTPTAAPTPST